MPSNWTASARSSSEGVRSTRSTRTCLRDAAAAVVAELRASTGGSIALPLDAAMPLPLAEQARAIVEGAVLGEYEPGAWKTVTREGEEVSELVLVTDADVSDDVRRAETAALWANRARDLVNRPANDLTPASFAEYAREHRRGHRRAQRRGARPRRDARRSAWARCSPSAPGATTSLASSSCAGSRRARPTKDVVLGLVGKGMTFDSGGISLKPATHMEDMKGDMAGAAAVVAGIGALAELAVPVRAIAVVAAAENMPSGRSMRPGDILTAANGKTIEVTNTDAEGSPRARGRALVRARAGRDDTSSTSRR